MTAGHSPTKAEVLLALHAGPGFVLPNAWDAGSARMTRAVELGAVGANLEDAGRAGLFGIDEAVDRIAAARAAAPEGPLCSTLVPTRTSPARRATSSPNSRASASLPRSGGGLHLRARRLETDSIFVPGVVETDSIRRLAAAIPGRLHVVAGLANTIDAPALSALGVKRVSLGGGLARAALTRLDQAAQELLGTGTLGFLDGAISYADLQRRFGSSPPTAGP